MKTVKLGQRVFWTDPDGDISSGIGTVTSLQYEPVDEDTIVGLTLDGGSEVEALVSELDPAGV
jgi:hypothetical protein